MYTKSGFTSIIYLTSALLGCFIVGSAEAEPLSRNQRQVVGELATGLLNTGTSFNPLYEGQRPIDSYLNYPGQYIEQSKGNGLYGGDSYMGRQNRPTLDYGNYWQKGLGDYWPGYEGLPADRGTWKGFGMGKDARGYPINSASQYGLKY